MTDRIKIGGVELIVMLDGTPPPFETTRFYPDISPEAWAPYKEWLTEDGLLPISFGFTLLRSYGATILVDTGIGPGPHQRLGNMKGELLDRLASLGIKPEGIDIVVMTHMHIDHVGWNVLNDGTKFEATFPKAQYFAPKADWDHFTQPHILKDNLPVKSSVVPLKELGVLELISDGFRLTPEVSAISTPGHTPGHMSILITSLGERGIILGDIYHNPAQVTESDWSPNVDVDKEQARKTRKAMTLRLEREGIPAAACHFAFPKNIGKVVRQGRKRVWQVM